MLRVAKIERQSPDFDSRAAGDIVIERQPPPVRREGLRPETDSRILTFKQLLRFAGSVGTYPPQSGGARRVRSEYDVLPVWRPRHFQIAGTSERELQGCVALPIVDPHVRTFAAHRCKCQPRAVGRKARSAVRAWFGQQRCSLS